MIDAEVHSFIVELIEVIKVVHKPIHQPDNNATNGSEESRQHDT